MSGLIAMPIRENLFRAYKNGDINFIKMSISESPELINATNANGQTLLFLAINDGYDEVADFLLSEKFHGYIDIYVSDLWNRGVLTISIIRNRRDYSSILIPIFKKQMGYSEFSKSTDRNVFKLSVLNDFLHKLISSRLSIQSIVYLSAIWIVLFLSNAEWFGHVFQIAYSRLHDGQRIIPQIIISFNEDYIHILENVIPLIIAILTSIYGYRNGK